MASPLKQPLDIVTTLRDGIVEYTARHGFSEDELFALLVFAEYLIHQRPEKRGDA